MTLTRLSPPGTARPDLSPPDLARADDRRRPAAAAVTPPAAGAGITRRSRSRRSVAAALLCAATAACSGVAGGQHSAAREPAPPVCAASPASGPTDAGTTAPPTLRPGSGVLLGVDLDWSTDDPAAYRRRSGVTPAVYSVFAPVRMNTDDRALVDRAANAVARQRGALMLTLEPTGGLAAMTPATATRLADQLRGYNRRGIPVLLRFAEEMNGSWYVWGQQPAAFVAAFRTLATAVHARARLTAMVWAPNYGVGYPFRDARQQFDRSNPATAQLDTNHDGRLTRADDPYAPFWPGDDAVDWVGLSLFHWGDRYPWDTQTVPERGKFLAQLAGTYGGASGAVRTIPDFVRLYSAGHHKPFAVTETAARFSPSQPGPSEQAMKTAWLAQVTSPAVERAVPTLHLVTWLEWRRTEPETRNVVDWRMTASPALATAWRSAIPASWRQGNDLGLCSAAG